MPWLTGDDPGSAVICRALLVPDDETFKAAVRGALLELTYPWNWEQEGGLTPQEAADLALTMWLTYESEGCGGDMDFLGYVGGGSGTYLIEDIPQEYDHLKFLAKFRTSVSSTIDSPYWLANEDTLAVYDNTHMRSIAGVTDGNTFLNDTEGRLPGTAVGNTGVAGYYGSVELTIFDYKSSGGQMAHWSASNFRSGTSGTVSLYTGRTWRYPGGAINTMEFFPGAGASFLTGSGIWIYGLRGE